MRLRIHIVLLGFLSLVSLPGCESQTRGVSAETRGIILGVDLQNKMLTLDHETVVGFMQAHTMAYPVDSAKFLKSVNVGDTVMFSLMPHGAGMYSIASLRKVHVRQISKKKPRS